MCRGNLPSNDPVQDNQFPAKHCLGVAPERSSENGSHIPNSHTTIRRMNMEKHEYEEPELKKIEMTAAGQCTPGSGDADSCGPGTGGPIG